MTDTPFEGERKLTIANIINAKADGLRLKAITEQVKLEEDKAFEASRVLQGEINALALRVVADTFNDWGDFIEPLGEHYTKYLEAMVRQNGEADCFSMWDGEDGATEIHFSIHDENGEPLLCVEADLFEALDKQWDGCKGSQAGLIRNLEQVTARLKQSFTDKHGHAFDEEPK